jgi:DNA-binding NarL/FixJ family response regulator
MPRRGGLDALKEIQAARPGTRVLVLSQHAEEQYAVRALRAGACGYVAKDSAPEQLVAAAQLALTGSKYVSPQLAVYLAESLSGTGKPVHEELSDRELQVLRLLASGKSVKEIGVELSLSEKTISTYRARILDKMGMRTNAELMRYALRVGLVD